MIDTGLLGGVAGPEKIEAQRRGEGVLPWIDCLFNMQTMRERERESPGEDLPTYQPT
jgi:hypothetical protein